MQGYGIRLRVKLLSGVRHRALHAPPCTSGRRAASALPTRAPRLGDRWALLQLGVVSSMASSSSQQQQQQQEPAVDPADPQQLWSRVLQVYDRAQAVKAAYKTDTRVEVCADKDLGIDFVLRLATALKDKPKGGAVASAAKTADSAGSTAASVGSATSAAASSQAANHPGAANVRAAGDGAAAAPVPAAPAAARNPFLPYEEDLWVCHLSTSHTLLLNKFNVVDYHLLAVTRVYESQQDPLNARDLAAAWAVIGAMPSGGLAFYNCGEHSGRSQPHKHVQIVPLPFAPGQPPLPPVHGVLAAAAEASGAAPLAPFSVTSLPFRCYAAKLPAAPSPAQLESCFQELLSLCHDGAAAASASGSTAAAAAAAVSYNALLTRQFMWLVPRRAEVVGPCAINSLGFAGTILVRSPEDMTFALKMGPTAVLAQVAQPWA